MKDKIAFIIFMILVAIFFGVWSIRAYTIVDTVYVPDSITVTMSWEEWREYLYWTAPDSGRSGWGGITISATCRVYGFLYNINGDTETDATVTAWLSSGVIQCSNNTDSTGYFYLDLTPGSEYEITIACRDGKILRKQVIIPNSSSWQIAW